MSHHDDPSYREPAKKIIPDSFQEGFGIWVTLIVQPESRISRKRFMINTEKKFADKPELVNWTSVGNFYYDTGDWVTALECYQNELGITGRREGVRETTSKKTLNFLEDKIIEMKKRLNR